ncbi:MAG: carbohydrate binding domain-containing protein [Candidatus Falkowbacteria bacterium]|nr:carbohydrate binding domain-containing protein [Candidatus Falkowbacteria bacterium]
MNKYKKAAIILLFFLISILIIAKIVFSHELIGRSLDFPVPAPAQLIKNIYSSSFYSWRGISNEGGRNTFSATLIPINFILYLPTLFNASSWFVGRYQIVLTLFLGMFFFYILAWRLSRDYDIKENYKILISIFGALFFVLNNYFFCEIMFGSNVMYLTFAFFPLLIYSLILYFEDQKKIFFFLSLLSLIIISSTLQHLVLAYIILFFIAAFYKQKKYFFIFGFIHFFLSLHWILPLAFASNEVRTLELAPDYTVNLLVSSQHFLSAVVNSDYFCRRNLYNLALNSAWLSAVWAFNAFLLVIFSLFALLKLKFFKKEHKKLIIFSTSFFLVALLFTKGGRPPLGEIVLYLYNHISLFNLYRSIQHYIGFYVIGVSILFVFSSIFFVSKSKKWLVVIGALVLINAMPWWYTLDMGTQNIYQGGMPSFLGLYNLTPGNWEMYNLSNKFLNFALLPIPPGYSINFEAVGANKYRTQGGDAGLAFGNKKFYAAESSSILLKDTLNKLENEMYSNAEFFNDYKNLFALLNIRYFVLRADTKPNFSINTRLFNVDKVQEAIRNSHIFTAQNTYDFITILKNGDFLPQFYVPKIIIQTDSFSGLLPLTDYSQDFLPRFAVFDDSINGKNFPSQYISNQNLNVDARYSTNTKKIIFSTGLSAASPDNGNIKKDVYYLAGTIGDVMQVGPSRLFTIKETLNERMPVEYSYSNLKLYKVKNSQNLLKDGSFENGFWRPKVFDCTNDKEYDQTLSMKISDDASAGKHSLELSSGQHSACTSRVFPINLKQGKFYKLSFDYKNTKGGQAQYFYQLSGKNGNYPFAETINAKNNDWNKLETLIEAKENINQIILFFYSPPGVVENINEYDNIELVELTEPEPSNFFNYLQQNKEIETPYLEFKKINPTKYRVEIHQAKGDFPLVFSEGFHNSWAIYLGDREETNIDKTKLADYKELDGNEGDQASPAELQDFINQGLISSLGNGKEKEAAHYKWGGNKETLDYIEKYKIAFISKNFQDTIQNDNLPNGHIWDTWFKNPLPEENHLMVNGYANSWVVETEKICKENPDKCIKNSDGTYDFELVIEFWPQRLFYLGLGISGATLLLCLGYLVYNWGIRKKKLKQ